MVVLVPSLLDRNIFPPPILISFLSLFNQALHEAEKMTGKPAHLLLTPACGPTQPDDIKYSIRVRCYKKVLPFYAERGYPNTGLILLPFAMRMAGPREALWHALIRKNFGCTHFIVGRDHAGPSSRKSDGTPFYGPYDAHELLKQYQAEIGIVPILVKNMVYLGRDEEGGAPVYCEEGSAQMIAESLVRKPIEISGTEFRRMLENREEIPDWYSFKPVIDELQKFYKKRSQQGFCVYFTGLPCSGKSTLAAAVEAALQEREEERRHVSCCVGGNRHVIFIY